MGNFIKTSLLLLLLCLLGSCYGQSQNCSSYSFSNRIPLRNCNNLPVLNASIHWNYHPSNRTADIAYRHAGMTRSNWIAWALNPSGRGMAGAQALVAFVNSTGSFRAYTSPIADYNTRLQEGRLSFQVSSIAAEFTNNQIMTIYATIQLPQGSTSFNQVWQYGDLSGTATPQIHPTTRDHLSSVGTIDFATAEQPSGPPPTTAPPATTTTPTPTTGENVSITYYFFRNLTFCA